MIIFAKPDFLYPTIYLKFSLYNDDWNNLRNIKQMEDWLNYVRNRKVCNILYDI